MHEIVNITLGDIRLSEYINKNTQEVDKIYIQNGILGFFLSEQEMKDLSTILNYYINIERIHAIT